MMSLVNTKQGQLKGGIAKTKNGYEYYEYLGIPYAKPPVGNLRFKSPQNPDPWQGLRDATKSDTSKIALQNDLFGKIDVIGNEDCLYLNVFTPKQPEGEENMLPVMVFFHGGGFIIGNGTDKEACGPDILIEQDVILVFINYRLGVLGFLTLDIPEASGNMGLKDQVKALKWVQDNISSFGGDKNNVTIFGVSAGSASVEYHILSTMSEGLFHKAILQSGSTLDNWALNLEPQKINDILLDNLNYKGSSDKTEILSFLLSLDGKSLVEASYRAYSTYNTKRVTIGFVPVIESDFNNGDAFLTSSPYTLFNTGNFKKVPVVRGYCAQEGHTAVALKDKNTLFETFQAESLIEFWPQPFSENEASILNKRLIDIYLTPGKGNEERAIRYFGDIDFVVGIQIAAKFTAKFRVPQYLYEFCYFGGFNSFKLWAGIDIGMVSHGDDIYYLFNSNMFETVVPTEQDLLIQKRMATMWTNFAKSSNPTPSADGILPLKWPEYEKELPATLLIDKHFTLNINEYDARKIAIFEEIYEKYLS